MRFSSVLLLSGSLMLGPAEVSAVSDEVGKADEVRVLHHLVTVERKSGDVLSESMRWHVFVRRYGDPGFVASGGRDHNENIVPTPGEPPPSSSWQPGDTVTYIRRATDGGYAVTRETRYELLSNGEWGRWLNQVKREPCEGPCPSLY